MIINLILRLNIKELFKKEVELNLIKVAFTIWIIIYTKDDQGESCGPARVWLKD